MRDKTYERNMGGGDFNFLKIHIVLSSKVLDGYFPSALKTVSIASGVVTTTLQLLPVASSSLMNRQWQEDTNNLSPYSVS